ncbi:MAG: DUF1329 domain-containing protein, partial [Pseudomonas sagittaria]|nr:DUF1329 domain-containing protein [Pseudomonas sagittaria]
MKFVHTLIAASLALAIAGQAHAAVSAGEAAKLGTSLTKVGADAAASADGAIPAYKGGLTTPPAGFKNGDSIRPDPFAGEKPLLSIDGKNVDQYKDQLTATTIELAKRFPTFRVDVYPTHRSVALPQAVLDNTLKNAVNAQSKEGGSAVDNVLPGIPFPIPKTGAEAMWNFLLRYQGVSISSKYDSWNVDAAGKPTLSTTGQAHISYPIYEDLSKPIGAKDTYYQMKLAYTAPARRAGEAIMLRDAANPLVQPRSAWQYLPGQRRVKLAPNLAYDTPNPGTSGSGTYDDVFVFNGALDRYDWTLVGKKEMYVPYNTYQLTYAKDPKQLTTPNHLSPDFVRWEKHRVWVGEGTLKSGARHIYHKRRFFLDEDS